MYTINSIKDLFKGDNYKASIKEKDKKIQQQQQLLANNVKKITSLTKATEDLNKKIGRQSAQLDEYQISFAKVKEKGVLRAHEFNNSLQVMENSLQVMENECKLKLGNYNALEAEARGYKNALNSITAKYGKLLKKEKRESNKTQGNANV